MTTTFKRNMNALVALIASWIFWPHALIALLHKWRGVHIHNVRNTVIAYQTLIDPIYPEMVEIEAEALITQRCVIMAHFRPSTYQRKIIGGDRVKPVKICRGVYIGMGSIILPGVTIGEGAVVGAGSVVTKSVAPWTVVAGAPAKYIKDVSDIPA